MQQASWSSVSLYLARFGQNVVVDESIVNLLSPDLNP